MKDIVFKASFGNEDKKIMISLYWIDTYYLFVDNRLVSLILYRNGKWSMTEHGDEQFTTDDIIVLAEMIDNESKNN